MTTDENGPAHRRVVLASGSRYLRPESRWGGPGLITTAVATAAAVAAASSGVHPTSVPWANVAWPGILGATAVLGATRRPRWVLWASVGATLGAMTTSAGSVVAGLCGLAMALLVVRDPDEARCALLAPAATAVAVAVLLRQDAWGFHGASALLTAVALAPLVVPLALVLVRAARAQVSGWEPHLRRAVLLVALTPVVLLVGSVVGGYLGASSLRAALDSARTGDVDGGAGHLRAAQQRFTVAHWVSEVPLAPLRLLPVMGQHVDLLDAATGDGAAVSRAGDDVLAVGSYRGLKTPDGRIDLDRIRSLVGPVGRARVRLSSAEDALGRASSPWLVSPARSQLDRLRDELRQADGEADLVDEMARTLPDMLGGSGERIYFVAFLNPAEERGGGGFLGSYAELRADDGRLRMTRSGSVTELIGAAAPGARSLAGPVDYLRRYGAFQPADFFQDLTFSPNFPYTGDVISQLYPQSGGTQLDGVLAVDPIALAAFLRFTGPISVAGLDQPVTSENAAQVILRDQYVLFDAEDNSDQTARRDVLDGLASETFRRLLDGDLPAPRALADELGPMVDQRRLQLYARRPEEQRLFERLGADGSMGADTSDDYLMVSHQNLGNNKIDTYLTRATTYRATVDPTTGEASATVTIDLANSAPATGLPSYVIGNRRDEPPGSNVMTLSIYSRLPVRRATIDGVPLQVRRGREAGAAVATAQVVVPPGGTRTVEVELVGTLDLAGGEYRLRAVPQAGPAPETLDAEVTSAGSPDRPVVRRTGPWPEPLELTGPLGAR